MTQQEFSKRYVYDASADELGGGGFAHVYKAWDNEEECFVALKIQPVDSRYPDLRLKNEVDRAASLRHPNVARYKACYTFSTFDGNKDIAVMSYYEHGSLDKLLCSQRLTDAEREDILEQILAGVDYLHSQGIIHRDLKPQNILVLHHGGRYVPKITDFGISKQLADGESSAVHNSVLGGTYSYASPEQLKETTIRKNTDLWSFGVIAYQMFAGVLPFNCGTFSPTSQEGRQEQFRQMTSGVLPEALNNIPEPWQRLIRECLVVDNTQRLTHVEDCMAILNNQPDDVTVDESTIVEPPVEVEDVTEPVKEEVNPRIDTPKHKEQPKSNIPTEPTPKNSKWLLWLGLLLLLVAVGGFVGYMMLGDNKPEPTPEPTPTSSTGGENVVDADSICEVQPQVARPAPTFTLAKSSLTVGSSSGSYSVSYTIENPIDGESVSVSDNQSWITNLSASGGKITFKTTDNTSTESRTGSITATYNGITRHITVTQKGFVRTGYTETAYGISMKMVWVEGGSFKMGPDSVYSGEQPVHNVTLDGYWIGATEVTQAQWESVMGTDIRQQRDKSAYSLLHGEGSNYPMYYVNYDEAKEFCRRLSERTGRSYTLPTEAQWEYAARGGRDGVRDNYTYSGSNSISSVAWYNSDNTHPVGRKSPNQLGLYDMSGNVWEWCLDWLGSYSSSNQTNPTGPSSGDHRVLRGGCWFNFESDCRVSDRGSGNPSYRYSSRGFRVVCLP